MLPFGLRRGSSRAGRGARAGAERRARTVPAPPAHDEHRREHVRSMRSNAAGPLRTRVRSPYLQARGSAGPPTVRSTRCRERSSESADRGGRASRMTAMRRARTMGGTFEERRPLPLGRPLKDPAGLRHRPLERDSAHAGRVGAARHPREGHRATARPSATTPLTSLFFARRRNSDRVKRARGPSPSSKF